MSRGAGLLLLLLLAGCPVTPPPGDLPMGQYAIKATGGAPLLPDGGLDRPPECPMLEEVTGADFDFDVVLTRESSSQRAWVTLAGYSREGTFDGQVVTSEASANRVFEACSKCSTRVVETISVAVLSTSQSEALGDACPESPLDGGVVANPDAGVLPPGKTSQGYDAVRVCGELTTQVVAQGQVDGGACEPQCDGCTVRYSLRGARR